MFKNGCLEMLDSRTRQVIGRVPVPCDPKRGAVACCRHPNRAMVVFDGVVMSVDFETGEVQHRTRFAARSRGIPFTYTLASRDGSRMALANKSDAGYEVFVLDMDDGSPLLHRPLDFRDIASFAISPDGQKLAFGLLDSRILIWDLEQLIKVH